MNRTELHSLLRSVAVVCLAGGILGISYGALAIGYGLPWWIPVLLSIAVVAGASEMMFVAIIGVGGSPWLAAAAGLLVNARHVPFGFQVAPVMGHGLRSILGAHAINDESTSFAIAGSSPAMRRLGFWACGVGIVLIWPLGTALGTWLGAFLGDLDRWGLDAVFPAMILALGHPEGAGRRRCPDHRGGAGRSDHRCNGVVPSRRAAGAALPGRSRRRPSVASRHNRTGARPHD